MLDTVWPMLQAPIYINWNFTYQCPLNCLHCYSRGRAMDHELSFDEKYKVAENIIKNNVFYVNFGGGEPMESSDLCLIAKKLTDAGVFVSVSTNGWNISQSKADYLIGSGIGSIIVSMDSADAAVHDQLRNLSGVYDSLIQTVCFFREKDVPIGVSTVVTKKNIYEIDRILYKAAQLGCREIELKRMKLAGNALKAHELLLSAEEEKYLYSNIKKWRQTYDIKIHLIYNPVRIPGIDTGCPCGKAVITIMDNGDISACAYSPVIIGNALCDDIGLLWRNHNELKKLREGNYCPGLEGKND